MKKSAAALIALSLFTQVWADHFIGEPAKKPVATKSTKVISKSTTNDTHATHEDGIDAKEVQEVVRTLLEQMNIDNAVYMRTHESSFFTSIKDKQTPRATVIMCSDSRVQTPAIDATPENDLFIIRNIGNQIASNDGSVQYGVHHLHTPLLLVLGHTRCGAIKAALSDYKDESPAIRRELDSLGLGIRDVSRVVGDVWLAGVIANVNAQVGYALTQYAKEIHEGKLVVVGAVYDLAGDMGAPGKLHILSINGKPAKGSLVEAVSSHQTSSH
ncbi:MAG: carbonic anhydrase [Campylobacterales bacterium]